ncbi:rod shape-determining protein MreD [Virgibacillus ihumii]|uniref:rod shape-determining protein MreD n=1 Tax=Virgibacillus ihumii TaxID=2686091 RepID=UPI00157D3712|nr:rod shape-determining protein MreD [Virgibacillus ihumii]
MKRLIIPFILFVLLIMEGVALELLPVSLVTGDIVIVPHWILAFLVMMAIFYDRENTYMSILYGVIFGLLIDVVYTGVLGVYMFTYAVVIYIVHNLTKLLHANIFGVIVLGIVGLLLAEISINVVFSFVGLSEMKWSTYLLYRMLPTVLANLLFLLLLYPITYKWLVNWQQDDLRGKSVYL